MADAAVVAEIDLNGDLQPVANAIGEAWVNEIVRGLRADDREVAGAWPGTLREARARVRAALRNRLDEAIVDQIARLANVAARRGWVEISIADPESGV